MTSQFKLLSLLLVTLCLTSTISQDVSIPLEDIEEETTSTIVTTVTNVQDGYPSVPDAYSSSDDTYLLPALQLGAQFVAAQAVADGLFSSSAANVTVVYSADTNSPSSSEDVAETVDSSDDNSVYTFDAELQSAAGETVRAQFTVQVNTNNINYYVTYYRFDYLVDYQGTIDEVEVSFGNDNFEYNLFDWNSTADNSETGFDLENIVDAEALPEFGESYEYDPNLLVNNWTQVDVNDRINNDDFLFIIKYGAEFAIEQSYNNAALIVSDPINYSINDVHSVYERNGTNGTDFKFDVSVLSQEYQTLRLNFQLNYNVNASSLNLYSWAVESITNAGIDF